jgi:hypothetical protein
MNTFIFTSTLAAFILGAIILVLMKVKSESYVVALGYRAEKK